MADIDNVVFDEVSVSESVSTASLIDSVVFDAVSVSESVSMSVSWGADDFAQFVRNYPFEEETLYNTIKDTFENWQEQRRVVSSQSRKQFNVNFYPITLVQSNSLKAFFDARQGDFESFKFTNPLDDIQYTVRFLENGFRRIRSGYNTYRVQLILMQVF